MTNFDLINKMSKEQLAILLAKPCSEFCIYGENNCCTLKHDCIEGIVKFLDLEIAETIIIDDKQTNLYLCDRKKECKNSTHCGKECKHTIDKKHAVPANKEQSLK